MPRRWLEIALVACAALALEPACGSESDGGASGGASSGAGGKATGGGAGLAGGTGFGGASGSAGAGAANDAGPGDATPDAGSGDPCPTIAIPTQCFGREVMYREWGASAVGDGTYFASQAPGRLGFTRVQGRLWLAKVQLEENTYIAKLSAYGDSVGGVAWIGDKPCDATFAADNKLTIWGNHGGGMLLFAVVKDDTDAQKLKTDPAYSSYASLPQLRGGHCYYLAFENTSGFPTALDAAYISSSADDCGAGGDGTCYYLAMDFGHRLHDITSGQLIAGNVIPGLTE